MKIQLKPIQEQNVVVVGATSGMGRETAYQFAQQGARVMVSGRSQGAVDEVVEEIRSQGGQAAGFAADVTNLDQMKSLARAAAETFGGIDTWVHIAGVSLYAKIEDTMPGEFQQLFNVNLMGPLHGVQAALPYLRDRGGALIVMGSVVSNRPVPYQGAYSATKSGLKSFLDALRLELQHDDVPVMVTHILPGSMNTPFFSKAMTRIGVKPAPYPPVYEPSVAAKAILYAAEHPVRALYVGGASRGFSLMQRFSPDLADKMVGATAFEMQRSDTPKSPNAAHNLYEHVSGYDTVTGEWGEISKPMSMVTWMRIHPVARYALMGAGLAAGSVLLGRKLMGRKLMGRNGHTDGLVDAITNGKVAEGIEDARLLKRAAKLQRKALQQAGELAHDIKHSRALKNGHAAQEKIEDAHILQRAATIPAVAAMVGSKALKGAAAIPGKFAETRLAQGISEIPSRIGESKVAETVSHARPPQIIKFRRKVGPVTLPGHVGPVKLPGKIGPVRITPAKVGPVTLPEKLAEVQLGPYALPNALMARNAVKSVGTRQGVSLLQGAYYLITGLLPIVSMRSFEKTLGERQEDWLMKTHSAVMAALGGILIWAGLRKSKSPEIPAMGAAAAATLAVPETYYMARKRIQRNFLLDVAPQLAFIGLWAWALSRGARSKR
jgi:NAD(P)-dependent dehydrogenase (short-subunit alcohol dehydrogenase family)